MINVLVIVVTSMYISDIQISGFRSFGAATELHLNPDINVVVGRNGSGKSNLAEAVAFVLQAPK